MDEPLTPAERRQMVMDLVLGSFGAQDELLVRGVATWAFTLAVLSDETLLKLWCDCDAID